MLHFLSSETGILVARLMKLVKVGEDLNVQVHLKGISLQDDPLNPLKMSTTILKRCSTGFGRVKKLPPTLQKKHGIHSTFNRGSVMLRHKVDCIPAYDWLDEDY